MKTSTLGLLLPFWLAACQPAAAPAAPAPPAPPAAGLPAATSAPAPPPAPAPEPAATVVVPSFQCRGNEPFWTLDLGPARGSLRTPETELALEGETRARAGGSYAFVGMPADGSGESVSALLVPAQCFDSMAAGPALPFGIQVSLPDGQVADGCCSVVDDTVR